MTSSSEARAPARWRERHAVPASSSWSPGTDRGRAGPTRGSGRRAVRRAAGDLHGGRRPPLRLRRGRGRGRGPGCPLRLGFRPQDRLVREHGRGGGLRDPAGHLHGGDRRQVGLRRGRGRGRGSGCPLGLALRLQDRLVPEHGRGGQLRDPAGHLHRGGRRLVGLRGGRGRRRGSGCPLGIRLRRQDRLVREHGRGGELRGAAGDLHGRGLPPLGLRGGRGRGRGSGCPLGLV
jgi:hypothetical protein